MVRAAVVGTFVAASVSFAFAPKVASADETKTQESVAAPAPAPATTPAEPVVAAAAQAPAVGATDADAKLGDEERARLRTFGSLRLRYDAQEGVAYEGSSSAPLSRKDLFARLGRHDLVAEEDSRATKRIVFFSAAGAALVAGIVAGAVIFDNGPVMNSSECEERGGLAYNECVNRHRRANTLSGVAVVSGALVGSGLFAIGLSFGRSPIPARETESLVAGYNGEVMKRLRTTTAAPRTPGTRLELSPQLSASGGGIIGRLTF